jgi:hypothetical protein
MCKLLDRWTNDSLSKIRRDVGVIVDTMKSFFELLKENDFDFMVMALPAEDNHPRAEVD